MAPTPDACTGPAPPKAKNGKSARILAVLDGVDPRGVRHVLVDDLVDPPGGLGHGHAERPAMRASMAAVAASTSSRMRPPRKKAGSR